MCGSEALTAGFLAVRSTGRTQRVGNYEAMFPHPGRTEPGQWKTDQREGVAVGWAGRGGSRGGGVAEAIVDGIGGNL